MQRQENMMGEAVITPATYQDLEKVPSHLIAEIIGGQLVTQPRPSPRHAHTETSLGDELMSPFHKGRGGPGGWWILIEPELHLGENVLVLNLAGWRRENMPKLPDTAFFDAVPDWICEITSPSTARYDRVEKRAIYARHGVSRMWMIDPDARTLEAFELRDGEWVLIACHSDQADISIVPFDAITFPLQALWAD